MFYFGEKRLVFKVGSEPAFVRKQLEGEATDEVILQEINDSGNQLIKDFQAPSKQIAVSGIIDSDAEVTREIFKGPSVVIKLNSGLKDKVLHLSREAVNASRMMRGVIAKILAHHLDTPQNELISKGYPDAIKKPDEKDDYPEYCQKKEVQCQLGGVEFFGTIVRYDPEKDRFAVRDQNLNTVFVDRPWTRFEKWRNRNVPAAVFSEP